MKVMEPSAPYPTRDGYKRTEVGIIPTDWEVKPLHLLAERITVGIANAATHAYRDRGVVMFRNQNIKPNHLDDRDVLHIDELFEQRYRNKRLKAGDLLTARTGYPGTTSIVPAGYDGAQTFTTLITRPRKSIIDPEYLCFFINSDAGQKFIEQSQAGGGQKNVNAGSLKFLNVALPPTKSEQEAIAEALSDADALIESLEQLLAKKRQIKQGAMQELLTGRTRLAGFKGKSGYRQSEAGEVPEDWEVKRVAEMGDVRAGKALAVRGTGPQRPYLRTKNVFDGRIDVGDVLQMPMTDAEFARYRLRHGDVLLNEGQSIELVGRSAMYRDEYPEPCAIQNQLVRFRARQGVSGSFAAHVFRRCQTSGMFSKIALQTTSVAHLGVSRFAKLPLPWPPSLAEQEAIAQALDDADAAIDSLEQLLSKKRQIKQGMMQELLTGRIRLV
jgi:restriction endonuclease S subunit